MNRRQRIATQVGGGLLLLALLFPPRFVYSTGHTIWGFITSEPKEVVTKYTWDYSRQKSIREDSTHDTEGINWSYLGLEVAIIAVIAGLVFASVKDGK